MTRNRHEDSRPAFPQYELHVPSSSNNSQFVFAVIRQPAAAIGSPDRQLFENYADLKAEMRLIISRLLGLTSWLSRFIPR